MNLAALALVAALPSLAASLDSDKSKILGNPNAPVTIEIYSDFECPMCRTFHIETLPQLVKDYVVPGKVCIVSREFPLDTIHKYSHEAANYATAAARVGKYEAVADALFKTQASWGVSGKVWEVVATVLSAADQKKVQALAKDPGVTERGAGGRCPGAGRGHQRDSHLDCEARLQTVPADGLCAEVRSADDAPQ